MSDKSKTTSLVIIRDKVTILNTTVPTEAVDGIMLYLKRHPHIDGPTLVRIYMQKALTQAEILSIIRSPS
jgi:hypothetical protein